MGECWKVLNFYIMSFSVQGCFIISPCYSRCLLLSRFTFHFSLLLKNHWCILLFLFRFFIFIFRHIIYMFNSTASEDSLYLSVMWLFPKVMFIFLSYCFVNCLSLIKLSMSVSHYTLFDTHVQNWFKFSINCELLFWH